MKTLAEISNQARHLRALAHAHQAELRYGDAYLQDRLAKLTVDNAPPTPVVRILAELPSAIVQQDEPDEQRRYRIARTVEAHLSESAIEYRMRERRWEIFPSGEEQQASEAEVTQVSDDVFSLLETSYVKIAEENLTENLRPVLNRLTHSQFEPTEAAKEIEAIADASTFSAADRLTCKRCIGNLLSGHITRAAFVAYVVEQWREVPRERITQNHTLKITINE